jgi:hypothetical protein
MNPNRLSEPTDYVSFTNSFYSIGIRALRMPPRLKPGFGHRRDKESRPMGEFEVFQADSRVELEYFLEAHPLPGTQLAPKLWPTDVSLALKQPISPPFLQKPQCHSAAIPKIRTQPKPVPGAEAS